jgi:hypothetical protein
VTDRKSKPTRSTSRGRNRQPVVPTDSGESFENPSLQNLPNSLKSDAPIRCPPVFATHGSVAQPDALEAALAIWRSVVDQLESAQYATIGPEYVRLSQLLVQMRADELSAR